MKYAALSMSGPLAEAAISTKEALLALKVAFGSDLGTDATAGARLASQLQEEEQQSRSIVTFCPQLDEMLGGGVATRQITEVCGVPGVGKTQLGCGRSSLALDRALRGSSCEAAAPAEALRSAVMCFARLY